MTRRRYLMLKAMESGSGPFMAAEAVSSVAIEHPEWSLTEERTFDEWEKDRS